MQESGCRRSDRPETVEPEEVVELSSDGLPNRLIIDIVAKKVAQNVLPRLRFLDALLNMARRCVLHEPMLTSTGTLIIGNAPVHRVCKVSIQVCQHQGEHPADRRTSCRGSQRMPPTTKLNRHFHEHLNQIETKENETYRLLLCGVLLLGSWYSLAPPYGSLEVSLPAQLPTHTYLLSYIYMKNIQIY